MHLSNMTMMAEFTYYGNTFQFYKIGTIMTEANNPLLR